MNQVEIERADQEPTPGEVTRLLRAWNQGDDLAQDELFALVYPELRRLAASFMGRERQNHTLQATALVHEAFIRLASPDLDWANRAQFFAIAAKAMRRILIDYARRRSAGTRIPGNELCELDEAKMSPAIVEDDIRLLDLDRALQRLETLDERQARIVELRHFAGLTIRETAAVLGVSDATVARDWTMARVWLSKTMTEYRSPSQ